MSRSSHETPARAPSTAIHIPRDVMKTAILRVDCGAAQRTSCVTVASARCEFDSARRRSAGLSIRTSETNADAANADADAIVDARRGVRMWPRCWWYCRLVDGRCCRAPHATFSQFSISIAVASTFICVARRRRCCRRDDWRARRSLRRAKEIRRSCFPRVIVR